MLKKLHVFKKINHKDLPFFTNNLDNNLDINIIVSRYNENLCWINKEPFNKYFITCYNKGNNNNFKINSPHKIIKLDNIGKCDHTYLYHIVNNYENLSEFIIFLPGSNNLRYKFNKSINLINHMEYYKQLVNIGTRTDTNIKNKFYNFTKDTYKTSFKDNHDLNKEINTSPSTIRPFGKWYEYNFGEINVDFYTWWGIFAISREVIYQHPKEYYQKLLDEVAISSNPEVGHYIERAWFAIFYPVINCKFIEHKYDMSQEIYN